MVRSRGSDGRSILSTPLSLSLSSLFSPSPSLSLSLCNFSNGPLAREKTRVAFERRMNCKSFETRGNVDAIPSLSLSLCLNDNIYIGERYAEITLIVYLYRCYAIIYRRFEAVRRLFSFPRSTYYIIYIYIIRFDIFVIFNTNNF